MNTARLIQLNVWGKDVIFLSEMDEQKRDAILSANPVKELFHKDTYGKDPFPFEGERRTGVLCITDLGPIVKYSERTTAAENNMRPSTMEVEWCCFLKKNIVSYDSITNENWGDYAIENENTKPIIIKRENGNYF